MHFPRYPLPIRILLEVILSKKKFFEVICSGVRPEFLQHFIQTQGIIILSLLLSLKKLLLLLKSHVQLHVRIVAVHDAKHSVDTIVLSSIKSDLVKIKKSYEFASF
jgi:hypothetical protein